MKFPIHLDSLSPLAAVFCLTATAAIAQAHPCPLHSVIPPAYATTEAPGQTVLPFGATVPMRILYAYGRDVADFHRPRRISGIRLRPAGGAQTLVAVTYDFKLSASTSRYPATALNSTFDSNHGADRTTVFDGQLSNGAASLGGTPNPFLLHIPFTTPFEWDPRSGPLLLDFQYRSGSTPAGSNWDALTGTGADVGRIADLNSATAQVATFQGGYTQDLAMVVDLCYEVDVAPYGYATTAANSGSSYPWRANNPMRVMYAYGTNEIPFQGRHRINALCWRTAGGVNFPGGTYDLQIGLSTIPTAAGSISMTFANNHGLDHQIVFDGVHVAPQVQGTSAPGAYGVIIPLTTPFEYDPSHGTLIVDIKLRSSPVLPGLGATFEGSNIDNAFRIYHLSDPNAAVANNTVPQRFAYVMGMMTEPALTLPEAGDRHSFGAYTQYPWSAPPSRSMTEYESTAFASRRPQFLQHLTWRPVSPFGEAGPASYVCTIDLSHRPTSAAPMSTVFDNNHGANRQRVFDGTFSMPLLPTGYPHESGFSVKLDTPYLFDPMLGGVSQNLIVDVRVHSTSGYPRPCDVATSPHATQMLNLSNPNASTANWPTNGVPIPGGLILRLNGDDPNATSINYGSGCSGWNGTPTCAATHLPVLPSPDFTVQMLRGPSGSPAFLMLGLTQTNNPLGAFGLPGCTQLCGAELGVLVAPVLSGGLASLPLPLPATAAFSGFAFTTQWAGLDQSANATGMVLSDAQVHTARFR